MSCSGIYKITCSGNGKLYVGSSADIKRRWREHTWALKSNRHFNKQLQRCWTKYGSISFSFDVLEEVDDVRKLSVREQFWIEALSALDKNTGMNVVPAYGSCLGILRPELWSMTESQVEEAISLFKAGGDMSNISKYFKLGVSTIRNTFIRVGFDYAPYLEGRLTTERMRKNAAKLRRLSDDQEREAVAAFKSGSPTSSIAHNMGVATSTILKAFRRASFDRTPYLVKRLSANQVEEAIERFKRGETLMALCKSFGVGKMTVGNCFARAGFDHRPYLEGRKKRHSESRVQHSASLRRLSDDQERDVVASFKAGATIKSLAQKMGVSAPTIRKCFRRAVFDYKPLLKGKKRRPMSEEQKKKISASHIARHSPQPATP